MNHCRSGWRIVLAMSMSVHTVLPASAADVAANAENLQPLPDVSVVGQRASLSNARAIKQQKLEIVDAIVVEEIGKLPDQNVTDALSRVTGGQVLRDLGEGAGVAIRGLTQIEPTAISAMSLVRPASTIMTGSSPCN